ncbi:ectoine/hydroxyectoine ABC transporter permease subunit EhuD [Lentibacillus cibarius]|uniref:Ectoine/hydroxyectoine ABC transporter permease subunit EhuD n=1 Tax=Lentibacillus cibarius TaxID=2583219 RepID=A0A549YHG0_9BACI|nr:ectoine/hydroxyectoine ABC transporter permease subunit EhuD [Lentibacillus cibarius]TMN22526.1 ectoine/hydroxyectoine ABC transporter permease subunit EhuD [Lentibacillus cibarius]TRM11323.1 ectoine/hydroxyectoine ABC transporter permease subunit EhuD [Lentibacillus cibarius]
MISNWQWDTFYDSFPIIIQGLGITLGLTIACYLFALIFGFVWPFLNQIPIKPLRWLFTWIMEFIRSTPPLVQLFFIFYALPMIPVIGFTLDPFTSAVLGLGIHFSTYIGEVYRSGIEGVDKGQWEAAKALNFSARQKWSKVILPQAIPPTIPMLGNYLIIMFKEVPLASSIGVAGILNLANSYGSANFRYLEPLTIVAILFLVLSYPSAILINKLERKMNRRFEKSEPTGSKPIEEVKGAVSQQ